MCHFGAVRMWVGKSVLSREGWADMKKTCERCANCHNEYMLGGYPTPVCKIYGYLEEINNPHHDLDGEKCPDYTYPMVKISFDIMINEIYLIENILGKECKYGTGTSPQNADS